MPKNDSSSKNHAHYAESLLQRLFPICRSITGNGVRQTLSILRETIDFEVQEIPSGAICYDWRVPDEWNVRDAYVADSSGRKLIDFRVNNIHLVSYSSPLDRIMPYQELIPHLHSLPARPDAIPYRTTYYNRDWGFCLTHRQLLALDRNEQQYHVYIDSTLEPGSLTYGEGVLEGTSGVEYLISTYCCHPSLANDNLSGVVLWMLLFKALSSRRLRHSYRFVIVPETIGAITYLSRNEQRARAFAGGWILTSVAGPGKFGYKRSFQGGHIIDRVVRLTFRELQLEYIEYPFDINGSDERQYSATPFRIPIGTISKDKYYEYDYYHTSLDNLDFISADALLATLDLYLHCIDTLEKNKTYRACVACEPMLGKRGLYPSLGGGIMQRAAGTPEEDAPVHHRERGYNAADVLIYGDELDAIRWLLFYSDGQTSLLDIAEQTQRPMRQLHEVAEKLVLHKLLEVV